MLRRRYTLAFATLLGTVLCGAVAQARPEKDGVYHRFDGDLALRLFAGPHFDLENQSARLALGAESHFFWSIGVYGNYEERLSHANRQPSLVRAAALGVSLRPLFLLRFKENLEQGPALLDLTLDSLSLGFGGFAGQPEHGRMGDLTGGELWLELGMPLTKSAQGPWIMMQSGRRFGGEEGWFLRGALSFDVFFLSPVAAATPGY